MAYHLAYGVLEDGYLAQDAAQEAFVAAYQSLEQLREPQAFPGWLKQIVVTQCHRLLRKKQVPTNPIEWTPDLPMLEMEPGTAVEQLELRNNVVEAIQALPEHEREVTKMFYLNGYSQQEIAGRLEIPVTTVKKRLQYARERLRGMMIAMFDSMAPMPQPQPALVPIPVTRQPPYRPQRRRQEIV
jgi:RNA polymerase sigma factor (sigma-70 family)